MRFHELDFIERMAEENEQWSGVDIESEYDEENCFYEDDDARDPGRFNF